MSTCSYVCTGGILNRLTLSSWCRLAPPEPCVAVREAPARHTHTPLFVLVNQYWCAPLMLADLDKSGTICALRGHRLGYMLVS